MQGPVRGKCVLVDELCCSKCEYMIDSGGDGCNHVLSAIVTIIMYIPCFVFCHSSMYYQVLVSH